MAATSVTRIWTAFLNAFHRILIVLGVTRSPRDRAAATARGAAGLIPAQARSSYDAPSRGFVLTPAAPPRERALPPTIKQRIRAEAHGSSPSVRRVACPMDGEEALATRATGPVPTGAGTAVTTRRRVPGGDAPSHWSC